MQISIDGFVSAGPNDEQKWVTRAWEEIKDDVLTLLDSCDTHVIGRKLAIDYIPYWQDVYLKPENTMFEVAKKIVAFKKIVFSKTLKKSKWDKTELARGGLIDQMNNLKNQGSKDILVVGGCSFVSELVKERLIDEFHLFVNPVALGKGVPIFDKLNNHLPLKLAKSKAYNCGLNLLIYELK